MQLKDLVRPEQLRLLNQYANTGGGFCDQYSDVYTNFTTSPSDADAEKQNDFVNAVVDAGVWDKLDMLKIRASHASGRDSLLDWKDPSNDAKVSTLVNAPTFTQYQGYKGDGSTSYIDDKYNPFTDAVNYTLNSASFGVYVRENINEAKVDVSSRGSSNTNIYLDVSSGAGNFFVRLNNSNALNLSVSNPDARGFYSCVRESSTVVKVYRNTTKIIDGTMASSSIVNDGTYGLMDNINGTTPSNFTLRQQSLLFAGAALTKAESDAFYNAFQELMTYYGTQV
jgi:hypothetical protein